MIRERAMFKVKSNIFFLLEKKHTHSRLFQVHSDFVSAAIRGCQAVVDGNIMAINPGEESK